MEEACMESLAIRTLHTPKRSASYEVCFGKTETCFGYTLLEFLGSVFISPKRLSYGTSPTHLFGSWIGV